METLSVGLQTANYWFLVVEEQLKREIGDAISWLSESHRDILKNFDPKVIKLRKKNKIIISPGALEDFAKFDTDDVPFKWSCQTEITYKNPGNLRL